MKLSLRINEIELNYLTSKLKFIRAFREKIEREGGFFMYDKLLFKPYYPPRTEGYVQKRENCG